MGTVSNSYFSITYPETIARSNVYTISWKSLDISNTYTLRKIKYNGSTEISNGFISGYVNITTESGTVALNEPDSTGTHVVIHIQCSNSSKDLYTPLIPILSAPSSIYVPTTLHQGQSYTVSWGAAAFGNSTAYGYELYRRVDGGTLTNIYTGTATSTTVAIPSTATEVTFYVRAYDSTSVYSDYTTSATRTVIANVAPTVPSSLTVPETINGGDTITVSWGASTDSNGNLKGYQLERSDDGGVNWYLVYQGTLLTTNDNVAFGTETVTYRVRAYDTLSAYSTYNTSATRTVINNNAPSAPASITVPNTVSGGKSLTVTWGAATDADSNLAGYQLERSVDGGDFAEVYNGTALSYVDSITKGWETVAYRVRAYDSYDVYSAYTTGSTRTVNNNNAPTINCSYSSGSDLGTKDSGFSISYSVDDEDGDAITVTEALDGVTKRQFIATAGQTYSLAVTGDYFMQVLNGTHTLTITANDGTEAFTHKLNFSKLVTKATITLLEPMLADGQITVTVLAVSGSIPADAAYTVEVTNNANDATPVWEDCTSAVKNGTNYVFVNATAVNGFAFNFRVTAQRANGGDGGYITSVQGGFQ